LTAARVVDALTELLNQRERRRAPLHEARVVGRNADGTLQLQRTDQECVGHGCVTGEGEGEVLRRPAGPCWSRQGTTGVAGISDRGGAKTLIVASLDPDVYQPGNVYTVLARGRGFAAGITVDFLLAEASEVIHPGISVDEIRVLDDTQAEIDITVAADAEPVVDSPLAYDTGDLG
jgi:hypothetical protein